MTLPLCNRRRRELLDRRLPERSTRPGSMTEKLPAQSSRAVISAASRSPASSGFGIGIRSNTTPQVRGSADPLASSPKSLSKVSKIR